MYIKKLINLLIPPILKPSIIKEIINKRLRGKNLFEYEKNFFNRKSFINRALLNRDKQKCKYLEIGVCKNEVFNAIPLKIENKIGVDPVEGGTHRLTSDEFFRNNTEFFDVIFIDGLHHYEQCQKDCINSLKFLKPDGIIFFHDLLPKNSFEEAVPRRQNSWTGDVWKVAVEINNSKDLYFKIAKIDMGVGILKKGKNYQYIKDENLKSKNFKNFYSDYYKTLPVVSSEEALDFIDSQ